VRIDPAGWPFVGAALALAVVAGFLVSSALGVLLLVVAGNETTRNAISHGVLALTEHADQRKLWMEDLERVSPEFARGVWANTRNKIVLYQSDAELCEKLAQATGTKKQVELTVRRSVDRFLNQASALEASSREVDEFVLHPTAIKALSTGQAYLVQTGVGETPARRRFSLRRPPAAPATRVAGVHLATLKSLPPAAPRPPKMPDESQGIGLYAQFLARGAR